MPATTPEQIHRLFEEAFNAGDLDGLMELYEPDAALIAQPGSVAYGGEQARAALQGFLALKGRITLETKLVVTVGELAYLANSWSLRGTGPDGNPVVLGATTAEVARRQADGSWRYVIDNAWGDQAARARGGSSAGAPFGGSLSLAWLPLKVVRHGLAIGLSAHPVATRLSHPT